MYKILIINLMYIGDLVFTTPFLKTIRQHYPEAQIDFLIDSKYQEVMMYNPHISDLLPIEKKGSDSGFWGLCKFIFCLRKVQYDLVINLHPNERSVAIAGLSGGREKIGFAKHNTKFLLDRAFVERTDIHQVKAYLEVAKALNIKPDDALQSEVFISENEVSFALQFLKEHHISNEDVVIGINVGGSWPTKRWAEDGFVELADTLIDQFSYKVIFFGGGAVDLAIVNRIVSKMRRKPIVATDKTSLLQYAALVSYCNALISGDSGPMHIAAARGVKVVALFGPSDPVRYAPYGQGHKVIQSDEPCLKCGEHECEHHLCMKNITVQKVLANLAKILSAS